MYRDDLEAALLRSAKLEQENTRLKELLQKPVSAKPKKRSWWRCFWDWWAPWRVPLDHQLRKVQRRDRNHDNGEQNMITITVSGPVKSGKTLIARLIASLLANIVGVGVAIDDDGERGLPLLHDQHGEYLRQAVGTELVMIRTHQEPRKVTAPKAMGPV